ncbi:MAG: hypothetical protein R6V13_00870 [Anaerolineae bacterium]
MSESNGSKVLTEAVKELGRRHGAALVGVAPIERFDPRPPYHDEAPKGHDPRDFVPGARSVISFAMPIMNPVMDAPAVLMDQELELVPPDLKQPYLERLYSHMGHALQDRMLEHVAHFIGLHLMREGFDSMLFPTTGIHPHRPGGTSTGEEELGERQLWNGPSAAWGKIFSPFGHSPGPFSHRHAATRAGLGEFGYNNIVLTREFGPRQRFNSIITEAELVPDPLIDEPICLREECRLCLEACYMGAITMRDDPEVRDYRSVDHVDVDRIFVDTPTKTDPRLCDQRRLRLPDPPVRGDCVRICPVPQERERLPKRLQEIVAGWKKGRAS